MLFSFFAEGLSLACFVKAKGLFQEQKSQAKGEGCLGWLIQWKGKWPTERGEMEGSLSLRWWFLLFLSLDQLGKESGRCYESWFWVICGLKGGRRQLRFLVLGREPRVRKLWFSQREGWLTPFSRVVATGGKRF